jgi:hypothetical protein
LPGITWEFMGRQMKSPENIGISEDSEVSGPRLQPRFDALYPH